MKRLVLATGIYPPEIGGPASFVPAVARFLVAQGYMISVVTYGDDKTAAGEGWTVYPISRGRSVVGRYLRYAFRVWREARHADLVFLQGAISEGVPGFVGAWLARKPVVLRVPGDFAWESYQQQVGLTETPELLDAFLTHPHRGRIRILEQLERWVAKQAKQVVVPSKYLRGVVSAWGVPADRIAIVYNDVEPVPVVASREELREQFAYLPEERVLCTVVRAVPWKGVDFIISLLPDLPSNDRFVVIGDGPMLAQWKTLAEQSGVGDRITFLGRQSRAQVLARCRASDAFLLASGYEGFPHVAIEAMMTGLPCFLSDCGGNPETKELFPTRVTILPYRDREAWLQALREEPGAPQEPLRTKPQMCEEIQRMLNTVV